MELYNSYLKVVLREDNFFGLKTSQLPHSVSISPKKFSFCEVSLGESCIIIPQGSVVSETVILSTNMYHYRYYRLQTFFSQG